MLPPILMSIHMLTLSPKQRISRRVIAEQHLALTDTFNSPFHFPDSSPFQQPNSHPDFVGEVFLRCNARDVVERCGKLAQDLAREAFEPGVPVPEIKVEGHMETTFPYILSHLEYMIGELLRNSIQATIETHYTSSSIRKLPPIRVLICNAPQHIIFRVSDQGGGIPPQELPHLWSFSKGPRSEARLENLARVPTMAATMQELMRNSHTHGSSTSMSFIRKDGTRRQSSLSSLTSRSPNLRLGMGLPMSRVYAEYWAGKLELHR